MTLKLEIQVNQFFRGQGNAIDIGQGLQVG